MRHKTIKDISYTIGVCPVDDRLKVKVDNPLTEFVHQEITNDDGSKSTSVVNDVYFMLNQDRLNKISPSTLQNWLDGLKSTSPTVAGKYTDDQLFDFIKSRHIQSQSELLMWSNYLNHQYDKIQESKKQETETKTDETKTDNNNTKSD